MTLPTKRLHDIELHELSLVTEPANQKARVTLFKSAEGEPTKEANMAETQKSVKELAEKLQKALDTAEAQQKTINELSASLEKSQKSVEMMKADMADDKKKKVDAEDDGEDDIMKSLDPRAQALLREAIAKAEASEAKLASMEKQRLEAAFITKAAALDHLPIDAESLGPVMMRMSLGKLASDDFETMNKLLAGVNEILKSSDLFKSVGQGGASIMKSSAEVELETKASELRKSDPSLTAAAAMDKVLDMYPELYARHLRENTVN